MRRTLLIILCLSLSAETLSNLPLQWRNIGPLRGGLWKTIDGGTSWNPVSDAFFQTSSVGAVAVVPSNPDVIYAGTCETELRGNIIQGDGVYKSIDAGKTWTQAQSFAIRKDPRLNNVAEADLDEQYRFAREIQDKFSLTNDTVTRIRNIRAESADARPTDSSYIVYKELSAGVDRQLAALGSVRLPPVPGL